MTAQKRDELRDMKTDSTLTRDPEIAALTRYYEHDGMLRAYANRAMFLALLFGVIAIGSLGFAIYVRVHPPTIIRVDKDGEATVVGARSGIDPVSKLANMLSANAATPDDDFRFGSDVGVDHRFLGGDLKGFWVGIELGDVI